MKEKELVGCVCNLSARCEFACCFLLTAVAVVVVVAGVVCVNASSTLSALRVVCLFLELRSADLSVFLLS